MALFRTTQFQDLAQSRSGTKSINNIISETRLSSKGAAEASVFLSHSHLDKSMVGYAVAFLRSLGITTYVDWMDDTMSAAPNGVTGQKIKRKIAENDKFIFLATESAIISKWCNWEVGIGDVLKLIHDKICILPVADNYGNWQGNEFLQIYPRIEQNQTYDTLFNLIYPDGRRIWFDEWLKK